ncbi:cyclic nucleotide-binding domain-containing protein [Anaerocolumna sedimenticola]|uniref:Cyclic nucleotide-binding domain-containing protein n=1 Tax=Anaerocolumna sedimenticola TaxID=2696063 RepID=A0A6P1THF2_9FIRM|nr:Crp/Fnr family transcriptional regulator [Anaerocolumna sedimenticola]QHQ59853.1 cyclic nucleotide-binding domain-containing protein [Anaerocolumna sedimenticola]
MNQEILILKQVSLFQGIEISGIEDILGCLGSNVKSYKKNQSIISAGSKIISLGIVLSGGVQVIREDILGNRMLVTSLAEGEIFGETFACAGIEECPVSVIAMEPSRVLMLPINRIVTPCSKACSFHSSLLTNLLQLLARKNLYLNNKMELISKRTIREKIMAYLTAEAEKNHSNSFEILLNRNEMADYLCIDRSAMSREISRMQNDDIIKYHKNHFTIL